MPRILVVDDSPSVRNLLRECLIAEGWDVECAEDAEQAAIRALSSPPDIVVSDLWMPGLSGLQLCRLLHEDEATAHVPIVLLSAAADRRSRFWAKRSGAAAFLDKSRAREIPALVATLLDGMNTQLEMPVVRSQQLARTLRLSSIPARLSTLLDRALFDMVLTSEVRGLALGNTELSTLFEGLATLLNEIISYRWLALLARDGESNIACVHVPADGKRIAASEAMTALGYPGRQPDLWVADHRPAPADKPGGFVVREIEHAGVAVGSLAVGMEHMKPRPDEVSLVALAAREIALPMRVVALIEQTNQLAATDALTQLPNRRSAGESLSRAIAGAIRSSQPLSMMIIDVDHFKKINDTLGHGAGDRTLQHLADVLRLAARKSDFVARWGGEEFLMMLPATAAAGARIAGERLRAAIAASAATLDDGSQVHITASIGIATHGGENLEQLIDRADKALYAAKRSGRNRVEVARPVEKAADG